MWYSTAPAATAYTITVTLPSTIDDAAIITFAVHGSLRAPQWDNSPSLPVNSAGATGGATTVVQMNVSDVTTLTPNSVVLLFAGFADTGSISFGAGKIGGSTATLINSMFNHGGVNISDAAVESAIFGAPQSWITRNFSASYGQLGWGTIGAALRERPCPQPRQGDAAGHQMGFILCL